MITFPCTSSKKASRSTEDSRLSPWVPRYWPGKYVERSEILPALIGSIDNVSANLGLCLFDSNYSHWRLSRLSQVDKLLLVIMKTSNLCSHDFCHHHHRIGVVQIADAESQKRSEIISHNLKPGDRNTDHVSEVIAAQILYNFPPEKEINSDVASFCFPHGVNPVLLERTPSMSSLNEIVYSQRFLHSDANSFTFLMKVTNTSMVMLSHFKDSSHHLG